MSQYTSYYLYQKYEQRDGQAPIPVYPNVFSVDGDGTLPRIIKQNDDPNCGYEPTPAEPTYAWNEVAGYVCDECEATKAMIHTSASTFYISGTGEITRAEASGYASAAIDVVITNGCTSIGNNAFSGFTGIQFARIPNTVLSIGNNAFRNCSAMTECQIPYGTTSIGNNAFNNCISLMYVDIPSTVTSIGESAYANCLNFQYVSIPSSITSIPNDCFFNCDGLSDIELPSSITSIGGYAFGNCSGLYSVTVLATTPPTLGVYAFDGTNIDLKIYVPSTAVNTYKSATNWSTYSNIIYPIQ